MNHKALINVCQDYILAHNDSKQLLLKFSLLKKEKNPDQEEMVRVKKALEQRNRDRYNLIAMIKSLLNLGYNHQAIIVDDFLFHYPHDTLFIIPLTEVHCDAGDDQKEIGTFKSKVPDREGS